MLAAVPSVVLSSCYVTTQGVQFLARQARARPVERFDPAELTAAERALFAEVARVRAFAHDTLGLESTEAYTIYYRTDRNHLVDVVSAVEEFSFTRKEWWFPVVGRVPYKGFYRPEAAVRLARRLRRRGWDVIVRPVEAFSTLGYFRDPLVSFMTEYSTARIAELIIHEMAHATIWVRDAAQFNEEFATFVGRTGAEAYLRRRFGPTSAEVAELHDRRHDADRFREDVLALKEDLRTLYAARQGADAADLRREKADTIAAYQAAFAERYDRRYRSDRYRFFIEATINNAYLDLFTTYTGQIERFERFHRKIGGGDLATTIASLQDRLETRDADDPVYAVLETE